jgi:hypothetical protein
MQIGMIVIGRVAGKVRRKMKENTKIFTPYHAQQRREQSYMNHLLCTEHLFLVQLSYSIPSPSVVWCQRHMLSSNYFLLYRHLSLNLNLNQTRRQRKKEGKEKNS